MKTILVCGGRDFSNFELLEEVLLRETVFRLKKDTLIVTGGAKGADLMAESWANSVGIQTKSYSADWEKHGKGAGPIRNQQMLDAEKIDLVIAFPGGKGTKDMITRAKKKGIEVLEVK